jgi:hypothetical protein
MDSPRGVPLADHSTSGGVPIRTTMGVMVGPARPRMGRSHVIPAGIRRLRQATLALTGRGYPSRLDSTVRRLHLSTLPPSSSLSSIASPREGGETDASAHKAREG